MSEHNARCKPLTNSMKLVVPLHSISWKKTPNHNARVNSHQRWKQMRFRVCFHLWCELTSTRNVTDWQVSWNIIIHFYLFFCSVVHDNQGSLAVWGSLPNSISSHAPHLCMNSMEPLHFILWKKTPNDAVTPQRQSQFTPKMKVQAVQHLLWCELTSSMRCNRLTSFMEFM